MKILTLCRLATLKVNDHLLPMLMNDGVDEMLLVRYAPVPNPPPKLKQASFADESAGGSDGLPLWKRLKNQADLFWLAFQQARRFQPDVIYGIFFTTNGMMAWWIAKLLGKKVMISFIGTDFNKHLIEYPIGRILIWFVRRSDLLTVFDEPARQKLIALGLPPERVFSVPHGIQMERFPIATQPKVFDAIFTGMFVGLKELHRLVAAWRLVVDEMPHAKLALVGDGVLRADLEAQVASLNLDDHVLFTGWVESVSPYLQGARIFCNVSNQEGVPHAMLEAMAMGLVPVVTAVGGVPSVIREGENGFMVENPADPAQMAAKILRLLKDDNTYQQMRQNALAIRAEHTYEAVSGAWTPIFEALKA